MNPASESAASFHPTPMKFPHAIRKYSYFRSTNDSSLLPANVGRYRLFLIKG
jgi:hypothetical protein